MTSQQILLIRDSWQQVRLIRDLAGKLFYQRLFELNPSLRPLFGDDIEPQTRKFMTMLGQIVAALDRLDEFIPQIQALGRRHEGYGVQPSHYQQVGEALLWTLDRGLGTAWTPGLETAWTQAFGLLSEVMITAQKKIPPAERPAA